MENQPLFNKSIDALLKAYQDGTLNTGATCDTTPVGHISGSGFWYNFFHTKPASEFCMNPVLRRSDTHTQYHIPARQDAKHRSELLSSGYLINELAQIDWAFKTSGSIFAVIDTLITIHGGNKEEAESAKSMFHNLLITT